MKKFIKKIWIKELSGALTYYTIIPNIICVKPTFKRIARFAPFIGLLIGSILACLFTLLINNQFDKSTSCIFILITGHIITGGIHLDGLVDTFDGIGAGEERLLEAMNDSRIGSFGAQILVGTVLLQFGALMNFDSNLQLSLISSLFWGRISPLWTITKFPYLRNNGQGYFHKKNSLGFFKEVYPSLLVLIIISFLVFLFSLSIDLTLKRLYIIWIGVVPALFVSEILNKKLKGFTGDSLGACVVLTETMNLIILSLNS